jgi:stearoyl-CoA desaturase (delta-9 desaturase)
MNWLENLTRSKKTQNIRALTRANTVILPFVYFPCLALMVFAVFSGYSASWWFLSIFMYFLTGCIGITVTFHRLLSHSSFVAPKWFERFGSICGSLGGTGSPIGWCGVHREHHKFSDKPGDPHSPYISGWKLFLVSYPFKLAKFSMRDMIVDPFHRFLHEYYNVVLLGWGVTLMLINPTWFLFLFAIPIAIQVTISNLSNYFNHYKHWSAYQNFNTNDYSYNSWWLAILAWGEGWHNNHHALPTSETFSVKWWEIDPSAWIISLVRKDK